jgi:dinuclear metal center YbgI/SA1388 family protein
LALPNPGGRIFADCGLTLAAMASSAPSRVSDLARALDSVAPSHLAEPWDNVGLLLGDPDAPCARALLTIDLTEAVLDEAVRRRADAVVAYHPPIFHPVKSLVRSEPSQRVLLDAAAAGIALLSPHTALDAAHGGVNDWLASCIGLGPVRPLRPAQPIDRGLRVVAVHAPANAVDAIRRAMVAAGAGLIGKYTHCSASHEIEGTFLGGEGTSPAVGRRGVLERVRETRIEMRCAADVLPAVVAGVRAAHPYEEPPIEVHAILPEPQQAQGQGRLLELRTAATAATVAARLKRALGVRGVLIASGPRKRVHTRVALCAGAGMSLVPDAQRAGATLFVTGEARHYDQLDAVARGIELVLAGHTATERGYLPTLVRHLRDACPGVVAQISRADRAPADLA